MNLLCAEYYFALLGSTKPEFLHSLSAKPGLTKAL